MKKQNFVLQRYDADEGMVFDYNPPRYNQDGTENHLYAKTIFLGANDSIDNYVEVKAPVAE